MKRKDIGFDINDFADYGPLKPAIVAELNTVLDEALEEDNIVLDDYDTLPSKVDGLISDMRNCPDLYVSASLAQKMGVYASQHNLN